jgi:hypothetical protein
MPEYDVSWVIGAITATSPQDAARQCREMLLDPDNIASVFLVQAADGTETEVDVLALSADNPDSVKLPEAGASGDRPVSDAVAWLRQRVRDSLSAAWDDVPVGVGAAVIHGLSASDAAGVLRRWLREDVPGDEPATASVENARIAAEGRAVTRERD